MNGHVFDIAKVMTINGGSLAIANLSNVQTILSCLLLFATLVWTCIKIRQAWRDKE